MGVPPMAFSFPLKRFPRDTAIPAVLKLSMNGTVMRSINFLFLLFCLAAAPATQPTSKTQSRPAEITFAGVRLEDALNSIRDRTDLNIHINWKALELVNVTRETPVSVKLHDVKIKTLLRAVLQDA